MDRWERRLTRRRLTTRESRSTVASQLAADPQLQPVDVEATMVPCDLRAVRERGYAVWSRTADEAGVAQLRTAIDALVDTLPGDALWADHNAPLSDDAMLTPAGLALPRLLSIQPGLRSLVLPPALLHGATELLGAGARIELAGAVVTDRHRPFFAWHTHIDGEEESARWQARRWPVIAEVRRILTLLYLDDVDDDGGPLLVVPRRVGDPCEPLDDLQADAWPGQHELRPRAGTLVALDECTWHAARPMLRAGRRRFVGVYFASGSTQPAPWADPAYASVGLTAAGGA